MHILLTDFLTCPRCGPEFGLVVLADRLEDRRVREGSLGCANCRESFTIRDGAADLRRGTGDRMGLSDQPEEEAGRGFRAAALLGAPGPSGSLLVLEDQGTIAGIVSSIFPETHVIGAFAAHPSDVVDAGILSRIIVGERLPFRGAVFAGVAILGTPEPELVSEARRVLAAASRLVIDRAAAGTGEVLQRAGFDLHLEQDGVVVAAAPGRG